MEFGDILTDPIRRRRLMVGFLAVLVVVVAASAVAQAIGEPALMVLSIAVIAAVLGLIGKMLVVGLVHLRGTGDRLRLLNDRYDETEQWLEQFDRGTRATFEALDRTQKELGEQVKAYDDRLKELASTSATREALAASEKKYSTLLGKIEQRVETIGSEAKKLAERQKKSSEEVRAIQGRVGEVASSAKEAREQAERISGEVEAVAAKIAAEADRLSAEIKSARDEQDKLRRGGLQAVRNELNEALDARGQQLAEQVEKVGQAVHRAGALTARQRGDGYAQFGRLIGDAFEKSVKGEIGKKLGLSIKTGEIRYLERKVQQIEAMCEGRLATTAEDAVARVLASRSRNTDELKILEIGVLFGVSSVFMHTALAPFYDRVRLVLLDPFDGYYGPDHLDPLTGQRVTRSALERNLARAAIPSADVLVLEGFSTDDAILEQAQEEGPFDVVVIDGDHSYEGVKADFERYAGLLETDGVLIVDDYGSEDWPDVTKFVDTVVASDKRFEHLGSLSRTAIFRKLPESSRKRSAPKSKSKASASQAPGDRAEGQKTTDTPSSGATAGKKQAQSGSGVVGSTKKVTKKKAAAASKIDKASKAGKVTKKKTKATSRTKAKTSVSKARPSLAEEIAGTPDESASAAAGATKA